MRPYQTKTMTISTLLGVDMFFVSGCQFGAGMAVACFAGAIMLMFEGEDRY